MIDERMILSPELADDITAAVREAANDAVRKLFESHQKQAAADLLKQQKKKLDKSLPDVGEQRVELYPIRVRHEGVRAGITTTVSMEGCATYFYIEQISWRGTRAKLGNQMKPAWSVRMFDGKEWHTVETSEDLESSVQQCVVALLGNVWYGHR